MENKLLDLLQNQQYAILTAENPNNTPLSQDENPESGIIDEMEANARLIDAAPELLAACQYVVNWHREHDSGDGELYGLDFVITCISAIDKARRGES